MIHRPTAWMIAGYSLCALTSSAFAAISTGTITRINNDRYTVDAGQADGLSLGQELSVIKNGENVGRLRVVSLREHDADATAVELSAEVVVRVGDTVTYEPGAEVVLPPPPTPPTPEPPTPEPPAPEPPVTPMPEPPVTDPATPETPPPPVTPEPTVPEVMTPETPALSPGQPVIIDLRPGGRVELQPANEESQGVVQALVEQGFENVMAAPTQTGGVYVEFENRRYRWEIEGLGEVMRTVARLHTGGDVMTVIGKIRGVPLYQVQVGVEDFRSYLAGGLTSREFRERLEVDWPDTQGHGGTNRSFGRVDATLGYGLRASFVSTFYTPPSDPQLLIRLGLESDLFKGFRARFRGWIPLNNVTAFNNDPSVATAEASYVRKFSRRLYGHVAAGTFAEEEAAVRGEGTYFISPSLNFTGQIARAGTNLNNLNNTSFLGTFRRQLPNVDADVFLTFGRFLYGDRGRTVGINTKFREREFQFAYTKTNVDRNLAFTIRWPLGRSTYPRPKPFRFRREQQFSFTYTSDSSFIGARPPSESFAESWQVANMPGSLPHYVEYLRGEDADSPLQEKTQRVPLAQQIGPSLTGSTGLWFVPAAEVVPYGYWVLGANYVSNRYRPQITGLGGNGTVAQYFTFGALPNLEITLRLTNQSGKLGAQKYFNPGLGSVARGYNVDRMVSMQYRLWQETANRPAAVIGGQDFLGELGDISASVVYKAYYGMLTKQIGGFGVHAGLGTDQLQGFIFGVDRRIGDRIRVMGDHQRGNTTLGMRVEAIKNVRVDLYAPGLKTFGAGITYTRRL